MTMRPSGTSRLREDSDARRDVQHREVADSATNGQVSDSESFRKFLRGFLTSTGFGKTFAKQTFVQLDKGFGCLLP